MVYFNGCLEIAWDWVLKQGREQFFKIVVKKCSRKRARGNEVLEIA